MGNTRLKRSSSSSHNDAICGDIDDVAQVSITSGSATNPPAAPRWASVNPSGTSVEGSIGRRESSAASTAS